MNLDEIQTLWEEDSKIDEDNLHQESTKIPALHAKYYKILNLPYQDDKFRFTDYIP